MSEEGQVVEPSASEQEARKFGWVPQEEFKGDPEAWRDADEFLKRGREINGYLRKDLEKINGRNAALEAELREVKEVMQEFKKFHNETEERAYKRALEDLKKMKIEAVREGDAEAVVEIDEKIDELKELKQAEAKKPAANNPPDDAEQRRVFNQWVNENEWYAKDIALQAAAHGFSDIVKAQNPRLVGREFLEAVKAKVQEAFPDKFKNTSRDLPPAVEGGNSTPRSSGKKKSYADLPQEAKQACDKFVKNGLMTQDQYVKEYFEGE